MLPCLDSTNIRKFSLFPKGNSSWHHTDKQRMAFTTAFGSPERRMVTTVESFSAMNFDITDTEPFDGYLKLVGVWENADNFISRLTVIVNGQEIWSSKANMMEALAGWPPIYWRIPSGLLRCGSNEVVLQFPDSPMLLNECSVFVRFQQEKVGEALFTPRVLVAGRKFSTTVTFYRSVRNLKVEHNDSIEMIGEPSSCDAGDQDFFFLSMSPCASSRLRFIADGEYIDIDLPPVLDLPAGLPCHVGIDCEQQNHDDTGMMEATIKYLLQSEIGDLVMFRPGAWGNYVEYPSPAMWRSWIDICHQFNGRYLIHDWVNPLEVPREIHDEIVQDVAFVGYHMHEPYFIMKWSDEYNKANDFQSRKDIYSAELKAVTGRAHAIGAKASAGESSWLAAYDAEADFDIIMVEAATSASQHFGITRGSLRGRPGTSFGHHIPVEWYLGFPLNNQTSRRFWLMMLLTFAYGGQYVYAENSLFSTMGSEQTYLEDEFNSANRTLVRRFYDMARVQPRIGEPCAELAVIYGNLESMFWHHDDILPETADANQWWHLAWNKWDVGPHKVCMRAIDAWLPPVEIEKYNSNKSILKWFSGNPYGNVEMISPERPVDIMSQYKVLAFLGWNTMTSDIIEKLKAYVSSGGTLFIAGCHFDNRVLEEGEYQISTSGAEDLLGLSVAGSGPIVRNVTWNGNTFPMAESGPRLCEIDIKSADVICTDAAGNTVLAHNSYGAGEVFFYNFWDHPSTEEALELTKAIMSFLGEKVKGEFGIDDAYGINCNHWYDSATDMHRLYLVNVNWQKPHVSEVCTVRLWGKSYPMRVDMNGMAVITIKNGLAVIPESPMVYVEDIIVDDDGYNIRLVGDGKQAIRVISAGAGSDLGDDPVLDRTTIVTLNGGSKLEGVC